MSEGAKFTLYLLAGMGVFVLAVAGLIILSQWLVR